MPEKIYEKNYSEDKPMQAAHKQSSTQAFTEILDIREDTVLMKNGNACLLINIQSVNFSLLSSEEQDAKVFGYAGLLNSLSFPVQIIVRSKQVDIMPYVASLELASKTAANPKLAQNISEYKEFVRQLVTSTTVLDKQFYMCLSYSLLEEGVSGATKLATSSENLDDFFIKAHAGLHTKAETLLSQIDRMSLRAKIMEKDELVALFHDIYNEQ